MFFFSSRRRHTRCALVTGVQTCALPIFGLVKQLAHEWGPRIRVNGIAPGGILGSDIRGLKTLGLQDQTIATMPLADMLGPVLPTGRVATAEEYAGADRKSTRLNSSH